MDKQQFEELVKKIEAMKKNGQVDLSTEEDLSLAIMNLIGLEEHFFFTAEKTGKSEYFDVMNDVREMRKDLLGKLIDKHEGETWCISKHLLSASMRLIEVGTKLFSDEKKDEAKEFFDRAYKMYAIFWAIRLKIINTADFKEIAKEDAQSQTWTYQDIVEKLVDCCDE